MKTAEEWAKERYAALAASSELRGPPLEDFIRAIQADAKRDDIMQILAEFNQLQLPSVKHLVAQIQKQADRLEGK